MEEFLIWGANNWIIHNLTFEGEIKERAGKEGWNILFAYSRMPNICQTVIRAPNGGRILLHRLDAQNMRMSDYTFHSIRISFWEMNIFVMATIFQM